MKPDKWLFLIACVGAIIAVAFSTSEAQTIRIPLSLRFILVTLGIGVVNLCAAFAFQLWICEETELVQEWRRLMLIVGSGGLGLILVILFTVFRDSAVTQSPLWWFVINCAVGLLFISSGFLAYHFYHRAVHLRRETMTRLLSTFEDMTRRLDQDVRNLDRLGRKIQETFDRQKNEIKAVADQYGNLSEFDGAVARFIEERDRRHAIRDIAINALFVVIGSILGVCFSVLLTGSTSQ